MPTKRQRSAAARLGWETRRANKRSAAARKGWATRRANEERNRRSEAAKKGWKTRRKNEERRKRPGGGVIEEIEQEFVAIGAYIGD